MALTEHLWDGDIHPIDLVESVAESNDWDFDRIADDQIAMAVEGQWRTYSITLAWSSFDETLRLICSFEMEPPVEKHTILFELLNDVNEKCWAGSFSFWKEQKNDDLQVWFGTYWGADSQRRASRLFNFNSCIEFRKVLPSIPISSLW